VFTGDVGDSAKHPVHPTPNGSATAEAKARAYLDVNCAICHHRGGPAPGSMDFRVTTALGDMHLSSMRAEDPRTPGQLRLAPGDHGASALWTRVNTRKRGGMPPLASTVVDEAGAATLAAWIDSLR
jgi:mono/diheme cytochrome c family protein